MEQLLNEIRIAYIDSSVNELIPAIPVAASNAPYSMRFNQGEEFFVELDAPIMVPRLPIHHDVRKAIPDAQYIRSIRDVVKQLAESLPECFIGLTYFFDPAENLKPCFYRMFKVDDDIYLYLLRIDLLPRPFEVETISPGTNDFTAAYSTKKLFLESELIPLEAVMWESGRVKAFRIRQLISQTWIGETGKGYLLRGIWMDSDLSKFFTKLFVPTGKRLYPYYPLFCKYKTLCATVPVLSPDGRRKMVPLLHYAVRNLTPEIENIQNTLKNASFSEILPEFVAMRKKIPETWKSQLNDFSVSSYLNAREQKEYALDYADNKA
ncbi:MAG: hypothetical protein E4H20_03835 [Spirochaetales bacterium]|nr:MAG: hypothetical protein E4H20_03835 [Spirochaetales bacterium]